MAEPTESRRAPRPRPGLARDRRGLGTVEYLLILALVAIAGFVVFEAFGSEMGGVINSESSSE